MKEYLGEILALFIGIFFGSKLMKAILRRRIYNDAMDEANRVLIVKSLQNRSERNGHVQPADPDEIRR